MIWSNEKLTWEQAKMIWKNETNMDQALADRLLQLILSKQIKGRL